MAPLHHTIDVSPIEDVINSNLRKRDRTMIDDSLHTQNARILHKALSLKRIDAVHEEEPNVDDDDDDVATAPVDDFSERSVGFAPSVETVPVPHLNDLTPEEMADIWWTENEYAQIRCMYKESLRIITENKGRDVGDEYCARGLELRTREGALRRFRQKQRVTKALLRAQEFQRMEGFRDPEYIAEICADYSYACAKDALEQAREDESAIQDYIGIV